MTVKHLNHGASAPDGCITAPSGCLGLCLRLGATTTRRELVVYLSGPKTRSPTVLIPSWLYTICDALRPMLDHEEHAPVYALRQLSREWVHIETALTLARLGGGLALVAFLRRICRDAAGLDDWPGDPQPEDLPHNPPPEGASR